LLELDEMSPHHASYEDLADIIRARFVNAKATLKELFSRIVFNILCGNTDDHARNHAAFIQPDGLALTPAYDICPQNRTGNTAGQAMLISGGNRMSRLASCRAVAAAFLLSWKEADDIAEKQIEVIKKYWEGMCDEAELSEIDRKLLWGRQFLNPFAFEG
jgi:serine/threonine-protein kinase HipA